MGRTSKQQAADLQRSIAAKNQKLGATSKGAPEGNTFKGDAYSIKDAIRYVMANYEKGKEVQRGQALKAIVKKAVDDAIEGDKAARDWLSERLEGKSVSITETTLKGDSENPIGIRLLFG